MKFFDYQNYIKHNPLLNELSEPKLDQAAIEKLMRKYPGKPISDDKARNFLPIGKNIKIHFFNGQNINGYKSIVTGQDRGSSERIYILIKYDNQIDSPYGEFDGYEYFQDLTLFRNPFEDSSSLIYKMQKKFPNFDFAKYRDSKFSVSIPTKIFKSQIGLNPESARELKNKRTHGFFEFLPRVVKIWG
jgi:hypothetical protein